MSPHLLLTEPLQLSVVRVSSGVGLFPFGWYGKHDLVADRLALTEFKSAMELSGESTVTIVDFEQVPPPLSLAQVKV